MKNVVAKNTTSLTIAGILSKVLGALYKFPLIRVIGQDGFGIYSLIYPIFAIFLIIATSAFPLGISRYISKNNDEKQTLSNSLSLSLLSGIILSLVLLIIGKYIAKFQGNESYSIIYFALCPIIIIAFLMGNFRGYFQGFENMKIVAISQVLEQILKIILGIIFCLFFIKINKIYAVLGLFLGIGISELVTTIWLYIVFRRKYKIEIKLTKLKETFAVAKTVLPISFTSSIMPFSQMITSIIILPLLSYFSISFSTKLFGFSNGIILSIINLPLIFITSLSTSLLPNISKKIKESKDYSKEVSLSIKLTMAFSLFFSVMFFIFSKEISSFLINLLKFDISTDLLSLYFSFASITIFYSALLQLFNTLLQSIGKIKESALCLILGTFTKLALLIVLSQIKVINMYSIFIAEAFSLSLITIIELSYLKKYKILKSQNISLITKPLIILLSIILCSIFLKKVFSIGFLTSIIKLAVVLIVIVFEFIILYWSKIKKFIKIQ